MADPYLSVHRDIPPGNGAVPDIMITLAAPHKMTAMVP
jgi:hypothetical protein